MVADLNERLWKAANDYASEKGGFLPDDTIFAEAAGEIQSLRMERDAEISTVAKLETALAEAMKTIEGLGRLGELVTAFTDPSGVLNVRGLRDRIVTLEAALEPFAKIAGPINGEEGRPTYLDALMKGETEELAVTTVFDTGGRGAVLWADDFRTALAALSTGVSSTPSFSPEQKRRALDLITPDHGPALELEEVDALRRQHRSTGGGDGR